MRLDAAKAELGRLIAFPTVSSDSNLDCIRHLADVLEAAGARVELLADETGTKANLWATLGPDAPGGLVLSGHTDVVPVEGQDWSSDPFAMEERDGLLYGRGACDMKGFIACCIASLDLLAEAAAERPIHFAFTHDEEIGCVGAGRLIEWLKTKEARPALAIIGEPTGMRPVEAHKGCCEYTVRFVGTAGHGSSPETGVNAVECAVRYVGRLLELREELKARAPEGSAFDPPWSTINVGALHGGHAHNVLAQHAELEWETRPVQASDLDFVKSQMHAYVAERLLPSMRAVSPAAAVETVTVGEAPALAPTEINGARDLAMLLTGANAAATVAYNTEAGLFQSLGLQAALCGPGHIEQAHKPDEYVSVEQMGQCLEFIAGLAAAWAAGGR